MPRNNPTAFYMVRLKGGEWAPVRKIATLSEAMQAAFNLASKHGRPATVIKTLCSVEVIDGKPVWTEQTPEN